jgi:hypothetical protein
MRQAFKCIYCGYEGEAQKFDIGRTRMPSANNHESRG